MRIMLLGGKRRRLSLAGSLFAVLLAVAAASMFGMFYSAFVANTAQHDAAAINVAGSLRMQSYRIATHLLDGRERGGRTLADEVAAFEERLHSEELLRPISGRADDEVRIAWENVLQRWEQDLKPIIADNPSPEDVEAYVVRVDRFVETVDDLVVAAQHAAEDRMLGMQVAHGLGIALLTGLVFFGLYRLQTRLALPLRELTRTADRLNRGDLEARARIDSRDELGIYARTFNRMADSLIEMQRGLEFRVDEKTAELRRRNSALELIYNATRDLSAGAMEPSHLKAMLETLERVTELGPLTLCFSQPGARQAFETLTTDKGARPGFCTAPLCENCLRAGVQGSSSQVASGVLSLPLENRGVRYGTLLVAHRPGSQPTGWQLRLAETVAGHIAAARARERDLDSEHRIMLMEERAVIARELHDSLAQALSYMKIQVARMQAISRQHETAPQMAPVLSELREGLNSAYQQLRELLTTFRLGMDSPGLEAGLTKAVREFSERGGIGIRLDYRLSHWPLNANEEIHLLQVAREALANVINHSGATSADVVVAPGENNDVVLEVLDNGMGIDTSQEQRAHHYGTSIMRERAEGLGGILRLGNRAGGGARVMLTFRPESMSRVSEFENEQIQNG